MGARGVMACAWMPATWNLENQITSPKFSLPFLPFAPPPGNAPLSLTPVDFSAVQVKSTVQLHGLSFEDCRKSHFNSIPDAVLLFER